MPTDNYSNLLIQMSFTLISITLVTGAIAERMYTLAYIVFCLMMAAYIQPIVVAWVWGGGWLEQRGFYDYAGSGAVYLVGGTAAFWGSVIIGERLGKDKWRS
jgi:Amt family ammonium transporter